MSCSLVSGLGCDSLPSSTRARDQIHALLLVAGWVFSSLFLLEALVKITAMGFAIYFRDRWNVFDFIIAVISMTILIFDVGSAGGKTRHVDLHDQDDLARVHEEGTKADGGRIGVSVFSPSLCLCLCLSLSFHLPITCHRVIDQRVFKHSASSDLSGSQRLTRMSRLFCAPSSPASQE